jgi:ubiquinone/menaquinone biosynthesis C-methylase UbiE
MPENTVDWHARFIQQARWTRDLRHYLYNRAGLQDARCVLEVGCGTGAILTELPSLSAAVIHGLDINLAHLRVASSRSASPEMAIRNPYSIQFVQGDALLLPYSTGSFDLTLCHFLLLWVADPLQVIREMARVTRPGGAVMALAEPDYGGRIDYPQDLEKLGQWQQTSLHYQGADPLIGRKVAGIFHQAGLVSIETGVLGGQWSGMPSKKDWELEWQVMEDDLQQTSEVCKTSEISRLKALDSSAREHGERVLFVPTFYAWGRKQ